MKALLALASAAALAAPSQPDIAQPRWSDSTPPERFNSEGVVIVMFLHHDKVAEACSAVGVPPEGKEIVACTLTTETGELYSVMPHPIFWAERERFAQVLAHELAHHNGWRHESE